MHVWVFFLNFQIDGFALNPNRMPKMRRDVDLMKAMFGEIRCFTSLRCRLDAGVVCCESLLFHGYRSPSSSSNTCVISWWISCISSSSFSSSLIR